MDLNQVSLIGRLGRDPDIRTMQSGEPVANMSIATAERWRDKHTGENRERTEWHRVVAFGKVAEIVQKYCKKGDRLFVQGELQTRKWTDQSGQEKYSTEVVLRGFNGRMIMRGGGNERSDNHDSGDQSRHSGGYADSRDPPQQQSRGQAPATVDFDDEVPF